VRGRVGSCTDWMGVRGNETSAARIRLPVCLPVFTTSVSSSLAPNYSGRMHRHESLAKLTANFTNIHRPPCPTSLQRYNHKPLHLKPLFPSFQHRSSTISPSCSRTIPSKVCFPRKTTRSFTGVPSQSHRCGFPVELTAGARGDMSYRKYL
jgi:hypothetical protein